MIRVLFICHGNICRSAMAEVMFNNMIKDEGLEALIECDSAATSREEIGNTMYPPAVRELAKHGMRPNGHRARQIVKSDYDDYDYLIGMDGENLRNMQRMWPNDEKEKIHLVMEYTDCSRAVADPWYTGNFTSTYNDLCEGLKGLLEKLLKDL